MVGVDVFPIGSWSLFGGVQETLVFEGPTPPPPKAGLTVGMSSLAAGMAIGVVGDAGVRANAQQPGMPNNGCAWMSGR